MLPANAKQSIVRQFLMHSRKKRVLLISCLSV